MIGKLQSNKAKDAVKLFDFIHSLDSEKLAKKIATKSPLVTRVIKKQINFSRDHSVSDSLDYAAIWSAAAISDNDLQEAMKSYIEKKMENKI